MSESFTAAPDGNTPMVAQGNPAICASSNTEGEFYFLDAADRDRKGMGAGE